MSEEQRDPAGAAGADGEDGEVVYHSFREAFAASRASAAPGTWQLFGAVAVFVLFSAAAIMLLFAVLTLTGIFHPNSGPSGIWVPALVISLVVAVWAGWLFARLGRSGLAEIKGSPLPGLSEVVGVLPDPPLDAPAPVDEVVARLKGLNAQKLPYEVVSSAGRGGKVRLLVRWRVREAHWRNLFGGGKVSKLWAMVVTLDPRRGRYGFVEKSSAKAYEVSWSGASLEWSGFVGKTVGAISVTRVYAPAGSVKGFAEKQAAHEAELAICPSDAKVPVFRILRAYGWRPNLDFWWSEALEY